MSDISNGTSARTHHCNLCGSVHRKGWLKPSHHDQGLRASNWQKNASCGNSAHAMTDAAAWQSCDGNTLPPRCWAQGVLCSCAGTSWQQAALPRELRPGRAAPQSDKAEVSGLRVTREKHYGNCSLTSLSQEDRTCSLEDSLSSLRLGECVDLRDRGRC